MESGANHFQRISDKKILHKVKKHWAVISLSVLAVLSANALAVHPNAYASKNTQLNNNNRSMSNYQRFTWKSLSSSQAGSLNQNLERTSIGQQAVNLHQHIIQNSLMKIHPNHNYSQKQLSLPRMKEVFPMSYEKDNRQSTNLAER